MTRLASAENAARTACSAVGLDSATLTPLHHHATAVYLLEALGIVVRVSRGDDRARARNAVAVAAWLTEQDIPVTAPIPVAQPAEIEDASVTFWRYYPQQPRQGKPSAVVLGAILRRLHALPQPPHVTLPRYQPLTHLGVVLAGPTGLPDEDHMWLAQRREELLARYNALDSELGEGFIHGDAYPGNTLWDGQQVILGDWDEVAVGPRELDLINTHQGARMGRSQAERDAFTDAYGWDVTAWSGFQTLREMRDVHTLAAFIERGTAGDQAASDEVAHRIATLRAGDTGARWHSA